ncbi:MAG: hypothetical protein HYY37_05315 [Candidatus Aenigmarchaeota archaeon]|nr:hypothetical protein [Candidatus Aenigmarchaeota archaeon]
MVDVIILFLAFTAGAIAFFSVCGAVVMPAYLTHYFGKEAKDERMKKSITRGITAGLLVTLGFLTVFGISGAVITYFGRGLIAYIPWISILLGAALIVFGALTLAGRTVMLAIPHKKLAVSNTISFYNFGIVYGIASLGCTLPIFVSILSIALAADATTGFLSFIFYSLGMGIVMLVVSVAAAASKGLLAKRITSLTPLMKKLSGVFIIVVGIYLIYTQIKTGLIVLG